VAQPRHGPPGRTRRTRPRRATAWRLAGIAVAVALACGLLTAVHLHTAAAARSRTRLAANNAFVPMLGSSVRSAANLAQDTAQFGRMPIVRVYYPHLPPATAWTSGLAGANKSAVIVSFKALPSAILSGADDAALRQFFDSAPTGHPIYYSYFHEPEDNIAAGQFTLAGYKAAWAHVVALANAAHNPYLHSTLILMEYDLTKASGRNWKNYLPGGGIISVLGWDAYPVGSATNVHPQLTAPADFMGPAIAAAKSVGLPYGFAEFGLSTPRDRPAWLTSVGKYLMSSGALFGSLFNGSAQYPTLQLTDPASVAVWRGYVRDSRTGADIPVAAPAHSSRPPAATPSGITGLTASPAALTPGRSSHTTIAFTLSHAADVTICILNRSNAVVRQLAEPGRSAGAARAEYDGFNGSGRPLAAGLYTVLVVAASTQGSSTAETGLTISAPSSP
jgi:hypothetical protein